MENLDSRLLRSQEQEQGAAQELKNRQTGEEGGDEPGSLRQRVQSARQALNLKEQAKEKLEEKVTAPIGMLKTKLLNLIPGYGPYVVFKNAVLMKKGKFTLVDMMIMLFSNLNAFFIGLAALAFIALIVTWATNPLSAVKAIADLGWGAVSALVNLFKGLL